MKQLAPLLREARLTAKLSQIALAKRLATSQAAVARLESGRASPTVATLQRWGSATGRVLVVQFVSKVDGSTTEAVLGRL